MNEVHSYGKEIGCSSATVFTMSFHHAEKFYQSLGYEVEFKRSGYLNEAYCLFLIKKLE